MPEVKKPRSALSGKKWSVIIGLGIILGTISYFTYFKYFPSAAVTENSTTENSGAENSATPQATAFYVCDSGLTVQAAYYQGEAIPASTPGQPPLMNGRVKLIFSNGRMMELPQTISADGARYATADDSFVFWSKGSGALIMTNQENTQDKCLSVVADPGGLPKIYASSSVGFSLRYPNGYTLRPDYSYQELGPGRDIKGVAFTIPATMATGTNLGADTYLSVEELPQTADCRANLFLDLGASGAAGAASSTVVTDNDVTYSYATTTGAGVGNRYEEQVYALVGTNPCLAIRYFIHYSVLENYPVGAVKAFDRSAILKQFDAIRRTVTTE